MHTHLKTIMNGSPYVVAVGSSSRAVAFAVLLVALAAQAHYMLPEIETVPTDRLIANLEKKLAAGSSESALLGPGEEIKIWSFQEKPYDGTWTLDTNGCITLPEIGQLKLAGLTRDEATRQLNGGRLPQEPGARGAHVEQTWQQRKGRLLPGETAELEYELARVHSIAYAQGPTEFQALKGGDRPFLGNGVGAELPPDRHGFRAAGPVDRPPHVTAYAPQHLDAAILHFRKALQLQTNHLAAQLGLGWCLQQAGDKSGALAAYRKALALAWEREKSNDYILETSWVEETAGYLLPLLDPDKDAAEIAAVKDRTTAIIRKGRAITPILLPLQPGLTLADLVDERAAVAFDLDGSGLPRQWQWITPKAAWLVFDPSGRGDITSGLQLFGNVTFWVFWQNGYQALSLLDDNNDGWLTGAELKGLALWQDRNGNGRPDPGEIQSLESCGITALSCAWTRHETGIAFSPDGIRFKDGSYRPSYDWIARQTGHGPW
jgi:tetratricopeptide (TPR) repeat protein